MVQSALETQDIQGDVLEGLPKAWESFIFFKICEARIFAQRTNQGLSRRVTTAAQVHEFERSVQSRNIWGYRGVKHVPGLNVGFTKDGLTQLLPLKPKLESSFEKGADHREIIKKMNDPPRSNWLKEFVSDRIDGVFLLTGTDMEPVTSRSNELLRLFGTSIKVVYSEIGNVRPGAQRGREHFGFLDGISQPGIRGLTPPSKPAYRPDYGLPGQALVWPGEFVFGYPGQHPDDPLKPGPPPEMTAPWMKNGSFMVFRRLEQKVPEFRRFVGEQAARLGIDRELLAARMVGRWKSGAPLERAPWRDDPALGADPRRNNDFAFGEDPYQRKCPYAAHIRKVYPRDDAGRLAEAQRHRIIRAGIPFGPELEPGETVTRHSRGLMFVCYQTSIERQFEYIQRSYANNPDFVAGKARPGGGALTPGFDPIIGQAPDGAPRSMDEPYPNYPAGNRRTTLNLMQEFVVLTAAGYFLMPSITALRTVLTR
jgi:Dyp-type peroxidase family